jgi:ribosomal protein S18 acetylase RimI-like enzyme
MSCFEAYMLPSKPTFRLATRADDAALIELKHAINIAEHAAYPSTTAIPQILDLSREAAAEGVEHYWDLIEASGGAFLVGEVDGQIICSGCWYGETAAVSTLPNLRRQAGIGGIVVAQSGRGQGLGRAVMLELETLIRKEGISHVRLTVVPGNTPAENLYHDLGFEDFEMTMIKALK